MTKTEATAEVFLTAFKSLPKGTRETVIARLADDKELREDIIDIMIARERMMEPSRPLKDVLKEIRKTNKKKWNTP
ncbi:MAG: hypothetical protein AB1546_07320 [bacterium]